VFVSTTNLPEIEGRSSLVHSENAFPSVGWSSRSFSPQSCGSRPVPTPGRGRPRAAWGRGCKPRAGRRSRKTRPSEGWSWWLYGACNDKQVGFQRSFNGIGNIYLKRDYIVECYLGLGETGASSITFYVCNFRDVEWKCNGSLLLLDCLLMF
jgi:hypothetical protein